MKFLRSKKEIKLDKAFSEKEFDQEFFLNESQRVAKVGSYLLNITTGYWSSSKELDRIFGIDSEFKHNVEGWVSIIHPDHRDMMSDYFQNEVLGKSQRFDKKYKIIKKNNGQELWVHGLGELIFDREGNPLRMLGTIQDITKEKKLEDEITKRNKELEKINKIMIGRESKMVDLKKEVKNLEGSCACPVDDSDTKSN